jgi:O-antigen/teichoic acid export membrane protein
MSLLKKNIAANFGGNLWTGLMGLAFVPLYIHFMGIEAYGLMGVFASLLGLFALLDMGLSGTLNREMARLSVQKDKSQDMRDLVRTLEIPYCLIGILIAVVVVMASPLISYHWVRVKELSPDTVRTAVMLMGLCLAFQWPIGFYSGGLMGLQRQVLLNGINVAMATVRGLGAVLVLWIISPTVEAYFCWQITVSAAHMGLVVIFLWRCLPAAPAAPRFRPELLANIWRFAAGMTVIAMTGTLLMQMDKIVLSRMLSLEFFGYYTMASVVAMTLYRFVGPVYSATYPKLTSLVELDAKEEIARLYHKSSQLVSVIILPAATIVAMFSREILFVWTRNPETVENTHILVSILVAGTAMNCILNIPTALIFAHGRLGIVLYCNVAFTLLLAPLLVLMTNMFGTVGAAGVSVILNMGWLFISLPIMHRRLLPSEKWRWYFEDVGLPFGVALLFAGVMRLIVPLPVHSFALVACIAMISLITLGATAIATPVTREWIHARRVFWGMRYAG